GGSMVAFSRPSVDRDGKADIASFLLAFAAPKDGADAFFFACERRKVPAIDRSALEHHDNGAVSILSVTAETPDPAGFAAFLATVAGAKPDGSGDARSVVLANSRLDALASDTLQKTRLTGVTFGVR